MAKLGETRPLEIRRSTPEEVAKLRAYAESLRSELAAERLQGSQSTPPQTPVPELPVQPPLAHPSADSASQTS